MLSACDGLQVNYSFQKRKKEKRETQKETLAGCCHVDDVDVVGHKGVGTAEKPTMGKMSMRASVA